MSKLNSPAFEIKTASQLPKSTHTLVLIAGPDGDLTGQAADIWQETGLEFDSLAEAANFKGKTGEVIEILSPSGLNASKLIIVGAEALKDDDLNAPRALGGKVLLRLTASKAETAAIVLEGLGATPEQEAAFAAGLKLRHYRFDHYKTTKSDDAASGTTLSVTLCVRDKGAVDKALISALARAEGTLQARDLVNEPSNHLGPVEFAETVRELSSLGMDVDVLVPEELEKLGMGALLAVARGSVRPARVVVMQWHGGKKSDDPIAFVGKGVVFDTGGISIKPAGSMENMKGDMGGAAAVVGLMRALALRKAKTNVIGVIGIVENMPDGNAYRPGDIVTSMSGQTIEIINTDAEGRLVLADALWYTQDRFKPKLMINLATLTGAIMVGLGQEYAGLFSNDDALAQSLYAAGLASDEKLWRMPLSPAYAKMIESRFADMKNTGGRFGGAITAAQFLQRFANDVPWAHLDIAGAAFSTPANDINGSWASGFGVALLDQFVRDNHED